MCLAVSGDEEWLGKICRLKVDRGGGRAGPAQAAALAGILRHAGSGALPDGILELRRAWRFGSRSMVALWPTDEPSNYVCSSLSIIFGATASGRSSMRTDSPPVNEAVHVTP